MTEDSGLVPGQEPMFELPLSPGAPVPAERPIAALFTTIPLRTRHGVLRHRFLAAGSVTDASLCGDAHGVSPLRANTTAIDDCEPCVVAAYRAMALALREIDTPTSRRLSAALTQATTTPTATGDETDRWIGRPE